MSAILQGFLFPTAVATKLASAFPLYGYRLIAIVFATMTIFIYFLFLLTLSRPQQTHIKVN